MEPYGYTNQSHTKLIPCLMEVATLKENRLPANAHVCAHFGISDPIS